jgi:hyperosmotically inducible protein
MGVELMLILNSTGCAGDRYNRSTGEYIDDHSMELRVEHALMENPDYKFKEVTIAAFKGVIQLNGFVDTTDQQSKAEDIVKPIPGVREVENHLMVENSVRSDGEKIDDKDLASRVTKALHENPEYKFDGVVVAAYQGTVQLGGFVDTTDQKSKASDVAKQDSGTKSVVNDITVKDKMNR